jgi:hypothetical protein
MNKVDGKTVTKMALIMALMCLLAYDLFAVYRFGYDGTISLVVFTMSKAYPVIPFLAGLVCGHLFFPIEGTSGESGSDKNNNNGKQ